MSYIAAKRTLRSSVQNVLFPHPDARTPDRLRSRRQIGQVLAFGGLPLDNLQMPVLHDILLQSTPNLIIRAVPLVLRVPDSSSAASSAPASSSWLPLAGAIGAVLGACIAGTIGFASSWYALRRQGLQAFN